MVLLVAGLLALGPGLRSAPEAQARDIAGNTYTSPRFGYSLTWDSSWLVMSEISEEVDRLELTNGISFASLTGSEGFGGNAQIATTIISAAFAQQDGAFDFVILESGGDDARHFVTASMTITFEDGTSMALTAYVEARTLIPGEAVVIACEPTLTLPPSAGRGGRAGRCALLAVGQLPADVALLCAASDGTDGSSGHGGAMVTGAHVRSATVSEALQRFDDASAHAELGTALPGGPTGTNLADVHVVARAR